MQFGSLFTPCAKEQVAELQNRRELARQRSLSTCYVGDTSQSGAYSRGGIWLPAICRSSCMVSLSRCHVFTPRELEFVMGWPVLPIGNASKYTTVLPRLYLCNHHGQGGTTTTSPSALKLSGNGMMLQQVAAFSLYIWGNIVRREALQLWKPRLRLLPTQEEETEDDAADANRGSGAAASAADAA